MEVSVEVRDLNAFPQVRIPPVLLCERLAGLHSKYGHCGNKKHLAPAWIQTPGI
jgi:hypothetical protein